MKSADDVMIFGIRYGFWRRIIRHGAGYFLLGVVCYWFNDRYRLANPDIVASGLLVVISAALMYELAGVVGLRLWTRRGGGSDTSTYQPPIPPSSEPSTGGRSD